MNEEKNEEIMLTEDTETELGEITEDKNNIYGFYMRVGDSNKWADIFGLFKTFCPMFINPVENVGIINADEVTNDVSDYFVELVELYAKDKNKYAKDIPEDFAFFSNSETYKIYFKDHPKKFKRFIDTIKDIASASNVFEAITFYLTELNDASSTVDPEFIYFIEAMNIFEKEDLPKQNRDFSTIYFIPGDSSVDTKKEYNLASIIAVNKESEFNYFKCVSLSTFHNMIDAGLINLASLQNMMKECENVDYSLLEKKKSYLSDFFFYFINNKCDTEDKRRKIIDLLTSSDQYPESDVNNLTFRVLNEVIQDENYDSENISLLQTEWLEHDLMKDSDDDDYGDL